jgi:cell division septation protein DedD
MPSSTQAHDDGFHEIQLNGKQLVFLFMAVTVVSVVIFLCGVLVGRGVRMDRGDLLANAGATAGADLAPPVPVDATGNASQPTAGADDVTYPRRLEGSASANERLGATEAPPVRSEPVEEAPPSPASPPPPVSAPPPAPAAAPAVPAPATGAAGEPSGPGIAIQVSAFRERREADALATRLAGKGYAAYVVAPSAGAPPLYRVRVGKFKDRTEANRAAQRLKKEEQFDPWIVP